MNQIEPEFIELERCLKVIRTRLKELQIETSEGEELRKQTLDLLTKQTILAQMIKTAVFALVYETEIDNDER